MKFFNPLSCIASYRILKQTRYCKAKCVHIILYFTLNSFCKYKWKHSMLCTIVLHLFIQQQELMIVLSKTFWLRNCKSAEILEIFLISPLRPLSLFVRKAASTTTIYDNTNSFLDFKTRFTWYFMIGSGILGYWTI